MSGRRWDGEGGRGGIESEEEEEAGVGLMSGVKSVVEAESSFGGAGSTRSPPGPSNCGVRKASGHVLVWNQPELDELTATENHNGYSHRPVPSKGRETDKSYFVAHKR